MINACLTAGPAGTGRPADAPGGSEASRPHGAGGANAGFWGLLMALFEGPAAPADALPGGPGRLEGGDCDATGGEPGGAQGNTACSQGHGLQFVLDPRIAWSAFLRDGAPDSVIASSEGGSSGIAATAAASVPDAPSGNAARETEAAYIYDASPRWVEGDGAPAAGMKFLLGAGRTDAWEPDGGHPEAGRGDLAAALLRMDPGGALRGSGHGEPAALRMAEGRAADLAAAAETGAAMRGPGDGSAAARVPGHGMADNGEAPAAQREILAAESVLPAAAAGEARAATAPGSAAGLPADGAAGQAGTRTAGLISAQRVEAMTTAEDAGDGFLFTATHDAARTEGEGAAPGETGARAVVSRVAVEAADARAAGNGSVSFDITTESGEMVRVRIALRNNVVSGRIGVMDSQTRDVLALHIPELNQRLQMENLVPQRFEIYVMGGEGESGRRGGQRRPGAGERDSRGQAVEDEGFYVAPEPRAFEKWA